MTDDRNGKSPVSASFVDMEAALNAEHAVESASEIHSFCAIAMGRLPTSRA